MASQSTTNTSPVQGPSSVSPSPSASSTSAPPAQQPFSSTAPTLTSAISPSSPNLSPSQQTQVSPQQSVLTSTPASLSSASQVASAPIATSQPLPSTATSSSSQSSLVGNGASNVPRPEADQGPVNLKILIPVTSAVAGLFFFLLLYCFYRRYRRRRQLKEAPLPAKRTPVILERRRAQSMYRFEQPQTPNNPEYDSLMAPIAVPPHYLGTASYLPFPSKAGNTFDGVYAHPSPTPSASFTPHASASVLSLERQFSTVSPSTPPNELKDAPASTLPPFIGNYPPPQFLQQPYTPPHAKRDLRPVARHSRPVSIVSVASRHSTYSLATTRSGQRTGSGSVLRGAPHRNNVNIILPKPLGPNSRPNSMYNMQDGDLPSVPPQHVNSMAGISPPSWNAYGELRHRSNVSTDHTREEWEEGNSGCYQGSSSSLATMPHQAIPHSQSAPAVVNWRHKGSPHTSPPDYDVNMAVNVPPVPPLPQHFQRARADSHALETIPANTLAQSRQLSPPRSPLCKRVSIDEEIRGPDIEVHTAAEPGRIPQSEEPTQQTRLLPDSVFTDPDGELDSATMGSGRTSASFTHAQPPSTPPTDVICNRRMNTVHIVHHAATPTAS